LIYLRQNWLMVHEVDAIHDKIRIALTELRAGTPEAPTHPAVGDQTNNVANPSGAPTMEAKELLMVEPSWAKRVTFTAANGTLILEFTGLDSWKSARIEVHPDRVLLVESQGPPRIITEKLTLGRMVMADGKVQWPANGTTNMSVTAHEGKVRMESGSQVPAIEAHKITMSLPSLKPVSDEVSPLPAAPASSASSAERVMPGPGMLGAFFQDVTPETARLLGLSEARGALVAVVYNDFPADKAGVKTGDVILRYEGGEVENAAQLRDMVAGTAPDTEVKLGIIRKGKEETLMARVGKPVQVMNLMNSGPTTSGTTVNNDRTEAALNNKVSLSGPVYPLCYPNAPTDKLSVQYAVIEIGKQAGLEYNWNESSKNTDPLCRQWVRPNIHDQLCKNALLQVLDPVGLTFRIENGQIVLFKK